MSNTATLPVVGSTYDPKTLALIQRTVAADCNADEFNLFLHTCRHLGLDPLRRQIYALVYNKNDPKKRKMSIIVGIDGFRSVAARSGNYRPDDEDTRYEIDAAAKSPTNPIGLVKASVKVWQYSHGQWFPVASSAYWDEFAPIKEEWAPDETGQRRPTGKKTLDSSGQWTKMPRLMLAKVAEASALRKAWPDDFSNVYAPEEMDRAKALDLFPSEAAEEGAVQERLERIGMKNSILMVFDESGNLEPIPLGKIADRCVEFIEAHKDEPSQILLWRERNTSSLKEFWAQRPSDALEVKKAIEKATALDEREPDRRPQAIKEAADRYFGAGK